MGLDVWEPNCEAQKWFKKAILHQRALHDPTNSDLGPLPLIVWLTSLNWSIQRNETSSNHQLSSLSSSFEFTALFAKKFKSCT